MSPRGFGGRNKRTLRIDGTGGRGEIRVDEELNRELGSVEGTGGDNINIRGRMGRIEPLDIKPDRVYFSHWDILTPETRLTALWFWDNMKLRIQRAYVERYLPTKRIWKKKKIKRDIELLFEDIDEEIYFEEQFKKGVKKTEEQKRKDEEMAKKALDDWVEALVGYDKFTVEEEKQIKKMFTEKMKELGRIQRAERIP